FGWNHIYANFTCTGLSVLDSPGGLDQFGYGRDYLMDPFTGFGCLALAADNQFRKTGTTSYSDSLSWVHGSHTRKFGFDFRNVPDSGADNFFTRRQFTTDALFQFGFNPGLDNLPNASTTLEDAALALWGFIIQDHDAQFFNKQGNRVPINNRFFRQHEFDWYGQDTWKLRSNLTLNLGLRYQLNGIPYEEHGDFSNLLQDPESFALGQPVVFSPVGPGTGKSIYHSDYSDIEPRVGLSWDPWSNGKTSVRAAFGIFHDRVFGNLFGNARGNPPFEADYDTIAFDTIGNAIFGSNFVPVVAPLQPFSPSVADGTGLTTAVPIDTH